MAYIINDNCVFCRVGCTRVCPAGAIYYDGDKNVIDQEKCVECGLCADACNVSAVVDTNAPIYEIAPHAPQSYDCDLVVVGAGGSGLICAARAAHLSGKRVIVLERQKKMGGCGWYSGYPRPIGSKWQRDAGIRDTTEDYVRAAINTTYGVLNPRLVNNAYVAQNEFFDWFCEWGEPEKLYAIGKRPMPGAPEDADAEPMLMPLPYDKGGSSMLAAVYEYCLKLGVRFLFEHSAEELITDGNKVIGVKGTDPGGDFTVNGRAVLVAAGNLANNAEVIRRAIPDFTDAFGRRSAHCLPSNHGDGVTMAEKAGIPIDYDNICAGFIGEMGVPFDPQLLAQNSRSEVLKVNLNGERFANEHVRQEGCTFILLKQPGCVSWHVLDSRIVDMEPLANLPVLRDSHNGRMVQSAIPNADGSAQNNAALMELGPVPPMFTSADAEPASAALDRIATRMKGGHVVRADTLEELAEKMKVPADAFMKTVERYNELCAKGHDDDFFKYDRYMLPIERGPFYAIHNFLAHDGVFGGYFIDENMRVIGNSGVVEGLYASGDNTSSRFINRSGQRIEIINDYPWALASGFIAGGDIARYLD